MSDSNYSVETEDHQSVKNLKNTFSNKEKKDNNITTAKNSQNLPLKQDANWVKKKKFSAGLTIQVNDDEGPNPSEEIPNPKQNNSTTNAENNDNDVKERIKKFQQASSRKKEEITFEELKSRKYVKTTSFEYGTQDSGSTKNETAVEIVVEVRNRRITEKFEENYDDDDPSENQDNTDIHGHVKERVEYFEHIKGSGDPEYIPKGVHDWEGQQNYGESQRNYVESVNEGNQPDSKRKDYASDISYETTYGKYKSPTFKEYNKTHKSPINKEPVKTQQGENANEENPLDNKRRDYASDISYETTYGKYKSPINKEYNKTHHGETVNASIQQENRRTDYTSDISYETTYGKYKSPLNKESLKTPSANEGIQANNKRTDYAQDISYETTYGTYKSPANKESNQTVPHQVNQEFKSSSLPVEGSSMHKSGSTYASSSYQPPRIKVEKDPEIYQPTPSFQPLNISQDTSPNRTQIQTNKPKDDDSYFRLDTSAHNDDNYFGKTSSIVIIDNNFESSFQKENNKKKKEGCCSAFCKSLTKIFKSNK